MIANGTVRNELILPKLDKSYLHKRLSCKADNTELAPERVQTVYIDLNFPPTLVQIANKDELLIAGRASEIRCVTSGSRPPAHIEWFLNERRIEKFKQDVVSKVTQKLSFFKICFPKFEAFLILKVLFEESLFARKVQKILLYNTILKRLISQAEGFKCIKLVQKFAYVY